MIQGTSSHAGKTTLVAAFCRLFAQAGYRVAPFKAQNMSNNAAVTDTGGEVGRAQAIQARAAGVQLTVDMNPILLKPQSDQTSQVVVLGHVRYTRNAREYYALRSELWPVVTAALDRLRATNDIVVMEGAGSPAEINLAQYDIVNMRVARHANAPVLLVGDIERGGVFAALYGTCALLPEEERALIRGFVINKFRGDASLLDPGFDMLRDRTGISTIGVLPYLDLSQLPEEDALDWDALQRRQPGETPLDIVVMRLPRVANLDEFQPLAGEPAVRLRFVATEAEVGTPDLIIIPGTKSTRADLQWLRDRGLDRAIHSARARGTPIFGICGGLQMLGRRIIDEDGVESGGESIGLALLPITTSFAGEKLTRKVTASVTSATALWHPEDSTEHTASAPPDNHALGAVHLDAYEIHMGRTTVDSTVIGMAPFAVHFDGEILDDGFVSSDGLVIGTYMHGLLENATLRRAMLLRLAARKGIQLPATRDMMTVDESLDQLASVVRDNLDMPAIAAMIGIDELSV
jgi:adenosylcobyric acid synthase